MPRMTLNDTELNLILATRRAKKTGEWIEAKAVLFDMLVMMREPKSNASYFSLSEDNRLAAIMYIRFTDPEGMEALEKIVNRCLEPGHSVEDIKAYAFSLLT